VRTVEHRMAKRPTNPSNRPIGEVLREHRVERLKKGLREMAALLDISPPHLTDIEKGHRTPSDDLLIRIRDRYGIDEATLRSGWNRPESIVGEVANQDVVTAAKVPEFLRTARDLNATQWDSLIKYAKKLSDPKNGGER
jgi:transcriptional regulator with XRE-family HTH domain